MTAYASPYISIGSLILRTRAIDCYDWSDLLQQPPKRGQDRPIPGVDGRAVRPRKNDALRAALPVRLNGSYTGNTRYTGDRHLKVYDHLEDLAAVTGDGTTQNLSLVRPAGTVTVDCIVESSSAPNFLSGWIAIVVLDVTLPDGPISLTVGS